MKKESKGSGTQMGLLLIGISMLALLVAVFSNSLLFLGISFLCIGVGILLFVLDGKALVKIGAICSGVSFSILGILIALTDFVEERFGCGEQYAGFVIGLGIGILMIAAGIFNITKRFLCNRKVEGTYLGANRQQSRSMVQYIPRFSFSFQGKTYENTSGETYSRRKINRKYEAGKQYPIYVSEKNPNMFRTKQGIQPGDILLILLGLLFALAPFLSK